MSSIAQNNVHFSAHIFYCSHCNIPLILSDDADKSCTLCGDNLSYLSTDLRPVFPEEKLLISFLFGLNKEDTLQSSIWAANSVYFINGKKYSLSTKMLREADVSSICKKLEENKPLLSENNAAYKTFEENIALFVQANKKRLSFIKEDAFYFVQKTVRDFGKKNKVVSTGSTTAEINSITAEPKPTVATEQIVLSFSGGKDSSASADVVIKALANPSLTHLFGDTTLEFPKTYEYVERYRKNHPLAEFRIAKNYEQNFYSVCEDIGPPARMMRWCCSMFKTGPITRVLNRKYGNQQILTFYGIRSAESVARSKYSQISENNENVKIQKQTVASPIFFWKDIDVWLYLLGEKVDFNDAYRLGYDRVGCWCCPNNNTRAQFLSRLYMKEQSEKWRTFLVNFARSIGKPDAEEYIDSGKWKARQGGNGVKAASDVKLKFTACTSEEHAKIYSLTHKFDDTFLNMLVPFGIVSKELGRALLHETIILEPKSKVPIISVQPFNQNGFEYAVKIKTMNVSNHDDLQRKIGYQVRKFNACRKCLKCESICKAGAISIAGGEYFINSEKCIHCKMCVTEKYLSGGCMMDKYLRTKGN